MSSTLEPIIAHVGVKSGIARVGEMPNGPEKTAVEHAVVDQTVAKENADVRTERSLAGLSVVLAGFGILIGWFVFSTNPLRKMPKILEQKWRIDELYNGYIVDPITNLSRNGLWKGFDLGFIDGIVNGIGHFVMEFGGVVRQLQVGFVRSYAAIILLGALVVLGYFIYYGLKLVS